MKTNNFIRYWLPVILFAAFIFTCSSMSRPPRIIPPLFPHSDKLSHFTEYAIFGFLLLRALDSSKDRFKGYNMRTIAVIMAVLYGISDELHQYFVPGRFMELADLISDGLGAYVGQLFFNPPSRNSPPVRVGMDSERNSASARFSPRRSEKQESTGVNPWSFKSKG